jgi:hypothetical protein
MCEDSKRTARSRDEGIASFDEVFRRLAYFPYGTATHNSFAPVMVHTDTERRQRRLLQPLRRPVAWVSQ